ncbi:replication initiation protein [Bacillus cereus]|nr:replication initiation protein [Bacillus cereus]
MSLKQDLQIKENNIVSKSNTLIEANSRLNLVEQKMLLCLASNIEPSDRDFKTYTFPIKQFHDLLGLSGSTKYTELSKITKDLLSKVIEIKIGEELIQVSWLSSAIYNKNKGTIDLRFDPLLKPFLLELSSKFTSYRLANVVKLKSTYAIRIYELLKQYEDIKERTISIENLRYYLDAIDVYPNYANLKQRVLKPSQKELNQKTDISFEFEEIKLGRKVQKIRFIIRSQKKKDVDLAHFEKKLDQFQQPNSFEQKIKRFEERCKGNVYPVVLEKWKKHKDLVLEIIDDIRFRSDIDSPIGYVEYMLNSRLKEQSDIKKLDQDTQIQRNLLNTTVERDNIIDTVIAKYSTSTGAVATFLVKDTAINELIKIYTLEEAEEYWREKEEFVMDTIYESMKKNRKKRR